MIIKLPRFQLSGLISLPNRLISHASSLSDPSYTQSNLNSSQYHSKIQSLTQNLHPETLINILSSTPDLNSSLRLFKWVSLQTQFRHTADTYYHIILKLGLASRIDEMEGFCTELMKSGFGFQDSDQTLVTLVDTFILHHKFDEALRVFSVMCFNGYKPSVSVINRLLSVLVEEKKGIKCVLFVYKEMVKLRICPDTETLNLLMQALFDAGRVDSVVDQFNRMHKKGCCANSRTYEIVVSGLIGKNVMNKATVVLNEVIESECDLDLRFFSCVLPLLFEMNECEMGLRLFEKMRSLNIVPDLSVYEVLIQYFARSLCLDDAIGLLNEVISRDLKVSNRVLVDLVNGFCKLNKLHEAKRLLEEHQVTNADSYNVVLEGYCQGGGYADVMWLFRQMVEKSITNSLSWDILISYLSENQRDDIVYKALTRMIVSGNTPNSTAYSALIIAKCKSNEVNDALELFHHVCEEQLVIDSSSFSMLVKGLCLNGKINKVVNLLQYGSYYGLSCSNEDYDIIMKSMSTLSESNSLLTIVGRMIVEGCSLSSETYNQIIKSMSDHQRSTECVLYLNRMVKEGLLPDAEILLISLSFLAQKLKLHAVLPAIHKLLSVNDHSLLNHAICNMLINGLWKEGYKREARLLLDVILENGWVPDATTHRLLVSSGFSEGDEDDTQDEITNILSEGFGEP
ncbi:pentatricopeptide repeat-containing protein At3g61360-like [Bidens hawaiensis]|uniref:pentatricopeptide repeat-containing protein At3g61360-like n=1 Tax=Bidens hawaiensis TaxID=980011 RepID=UPI004048FC55